VLTWSKRPGEAVREGENLVELETDKVVLEVPAPRTGVLGEILAEEGALVQTDDVLALISEGAVSAAPANTASTAAPATTPHNPPPRPSRAQHPMSRPPRVSWSRNCIWNRARSPVATDASQKADVLAYLDARERQAPERHPDLSAAPVSQTQVEPAIAPAPALSGEAGRPEQRVPMTRLRARIAERLLQAQQNAALLTTFNEVNLSAVNALRARYKETFEQRHGVRLGLMSFFVKAAVEALQRFPVLNASIDGEDILYHGYYDIGIAVSSPRGLVVPILRNADQLGMAEIEQGIADFGQKAKDGSLSYEELTGGTFSITNGGVFGSLLSTPILNPPQSAILGLHKIQERPIVESGQIVVAPMMYLALTYDHRLIDGRDAVQFLVAIKELLEDPARLLLRV
jgi:2-oxoglutarate dehydrogenase E2 component (dihydrolipoamide succinyltransferase)